MMKGRALRAAEAERDRLRRALEDAAGSLTWIAEQRASQGAERPMGDVLAEVRAYAHSRAAVARAALALNGTKEG